MSVSSFHCPDVHFSTILLLVEIAVDDGKFKLSSLHQSAIALNCYMNKCGISFLQAVTWLAVLAEIAARYDRDGIDVFFLNSPMFGKNIKVSSLLSILVGDTNLIASLVHRAGKK